MVHLSKNSTASTLENAEGDGVTGSGHLHWISPVSRQSELQKYKKGY